MHANITYEDIDLLAGECVAFADLRATDKDAIMSLCLFAGKLRGLAYAGEPVGSHEMTTLYTSAQAYLSVLSREALKDVPA